MKEEALMILSVVAMMGIFLVALALVARAPSGTAPGIGPTMCPYGYVCGTPSDGCAFPGAVYNCPMFPSNNSANATVAVDLGGELINSGAAGFTLNRTAFYSNSSYQCSLQPISYCDNNEPSQFICVNQRYSALVSAQYNQTQQGGGVCPMLFMQGNVSCGIESNYCVVTRG